MITKVSLARVILGITALSGFSTTQPSLRVSGGIILNGVVQPLLFTWNSTVPISGGGWAPGEPVRIDLHRTFGLSRATRGGIGRPGARLEALEAPLLIRQPPAGTNNALGDIPLGVFPADAQGNLSAAPVIPYDSGMTGLQVRIPRPGYYEVLATGAASGRSVAPDLINLSPDTYTGPGGAPFDWGHDRGARDGVFPDGLRAYSPERFDPEWPTVWDERPVELYGAVAPAEAGGGQPSLISYTDNPATHYGHDANYFVEPDGPYRWLVGIANYYNADPESPGAGRIEVEWETLNGGSTATYGKGNIGAPVWVNPTAGDRIYVVGRWIADAGHPELGDRTEIHPPRLVATMRQRPGILNGAAARVVDIYASGHGGGANSMPPGLSLLLDDFGNGGGRIRDALSPADQDKYYQPGPLDSLLYPLLAQLVHQLTGVSISTPVHSDAGPSAFPWGTPGTEQRPLNDMNYDFDVPLAPAPPAATSVAMHAVTRPEHTTAVTEVVTFRGPPTGPPTVAHIHLPYRGADNGIYARSLSFAWNQAPAPASHWIVRLNRIDVVDSPGRWQLWADVSGQWTYLSGVAPGLLQTTAGASIALPGGAQDVFLNSGQTVLVFVHGYRAACLDDFFGKLFGQPSYLAGLSFVGQCGPVDNQDLGGALLELPATPSPAGTYTVTASDSAGNHHFSVAVSVDLP